jgi:hypothetical protein
MGALLTISPEQNPLHYYYASHKLTLLIHTPNTQKGEGCSSSLMTEFSRICTQIRINAQNRFLKEHSLPLDNVQAILQWTPTILQ